MKLVVLTLVSLLLSLDEAAAQALLPKSYRQKLIPVEQPLVLTYAFGPEPGNAATLNVVNYPGMKSDLFFFHMHVNETTAKKAGEEAVRAAGGTFMYLHHPANMRNMRAKIGGRLYEFDPNRIFTEKALAEKTAPRPTPADLQELRKFVAWIKANIEIARAQRTRPMVTALHNNTDDDVHGELLSIRTEAKLMGIDNRAVNASKTWDIDNFYIATMKKTYDALIAAFNPNISLRLEKPRDIGYLSNWMIKDGIEYINSETEHEDLEANKRMIEIVQDTFR